MANLKDLCANLPYQFVELELRRRKAASYQKRVDSLCAEDRVFDACQQRRPSKRKVQNRFSKEEAGTRGAVTMGIRTGAHSVCVCKVQQKW